MKFSSIKLVQLALLITFLPCLGHLTSFGVALIAKGGIESSDLDEFDLGRGSDEPKNEPSLGSVQSLQGL